MGAPGYACFCRKGHLVKAVSHHEIDDREFTECPWCGENEFFTQIEWGSKDVKQIVPTKPKKFEKVECESIYGEKYHDDIPVYDVSKVKVKQWKEIAR